MPHVGRAVRLVTDGDAEVRFAGLVALFPFSNVTPKQLLSAFVTKREVRVNRAVWPREGRFDQRETSAVACYDADAEPRRSRNQVRYGHSEREEERERA
jgi:hypothetical protein